jgi:deoxyribodipyrimidine photo-lyase
MLLFWHQKDLRIEENLALLKAWKTDKKILSVFILSPHEKLGLASRWWLYHSLKSLAKEYQKRGGKLLLKKRRSWNNSSSFIKKDQSYGSLL